MELAGKMVIVTGPRGAGKTSLCRRLVDLGREQGLTVAGLLSHARFEGTRKTGIETEDLATGERRLLAIPRSEPSRDGLQLGWIFDPDVLAWGNAVLARPGSVDLLVVDELGPLEFDQSRGWTAGLAALDRGDYRIALAVIRPGLLAQAQLRWGGAAIVEIASIGDLEEVFSSVASALVAVE